jgi:hypothetical protein
MRFEIGGTNGDAWSAGFCRPGGLDSWMTAEPAATGD